jgi:hypothetical protein
MSPRTVSSVTPLTPQAQAVFDAWVAPARAVKPWHLNQGSRACLAAALVAVANEAVPSHMAWHSLQEQERSSHYASASDQAAAQGIACVIRRRILLIASEIEGLGRYVEEIAPIDDPDRLDQINQDMPKTP